MQGTAEPRGRDARGAGWLPASKLDAAGRVRIDMRVVLALALPLFLNSSLQAILNLTDTWFISRLSPVALAAAAAVHWLVLGVIVLAGGVAMAVQTFAAQAYGARRHRRASVALWSGVWSTAVLAPLLVLVAWSGQWWLPRLGLDPLVSAQAAAYWQPRLGGAVLGLLLWCALSFFNGVSLVRVTLLVNLVVTVSNAAFNEWFIFGLGWGIAGAAWGTNAAQGVGVLLAFGVLLGSRALRDRYATRLTWRLGWRRMRALIAVGLGIGLMVSFDLLGMAMFQLIMTRHGILDGAATQVVMMLTSVSFMPAIGLCMAGTTLVGQSIGAGQLDWAWKLGNRVMWMATGYMGSVGLVLAAAGPWLVPLFAGDGPDAETLVTLGCTLLWIAACYQLVDGMQLGCNFCLRGAGDTRFLAKAMIVLIWVVYLPLTHWLTFARGEGIVPALGGLGAGAAGGWWAAVIYVTLLAVLTLWRWRSRRWMRIRLIDGRAAPRAAAEPPAHASLGCQGCGVDATASDWDRTP